MAEGRNDFGHKLWDFDRESLRVEGLRLLFGDFNFSVNFKRIVGADLRAEPVLQWGDQAPPVGVVLGVCLCNK